MRRFLINACLFSVFCFAFYLGLLFISQHSLPALLKKNLTYKKGGGGFTNTRLKEAAESADVDILILGSSHAYRGYDPRIFEKYGYKIFNLGSSAQTPIETEILFNKYSKKLNPKLVIIDIYPVTFKSEAIESNLDLIANGDVDNALFIQSLKSKNIKVYNSILYKMVYDTKGNRNFKDPASFKKNKYIHGGYVESYAKLDISKLKVTPNRKYEIDEEQLSALKEIISGCKKKNYKYILIQSPLPGIVYKSYTNNADVDKIFSALGSYTNYNESLKIADSCFFDNSHLNQYGVDIFNKQLIETQLPSI